MKIALLWLTLLTLKGRVHLKFLSHVLVMRLVEGMRTVIQTRSEQEVRISLIASPEALQDRKAWLLATIGHWKRLVHQGQNL